MARRAACGGRTLAVAALLGGTLMGLASQVAAAAGPVVSTYVGTGEPGLGDEHESRYEAAIAEPYGLACDGEGNLYFSDYENNRVRRVDARSGEVTTIAEIPAPQGLALDGRGRLYAGSMQGVVWRVDLASGNSTVVAGGGEEQADRGAATSLALLVPAGVGTDAAGRLYVADANLHAVFRLDPDSGELVRVAGRRGERGYAGDGGTATEALLNSPSDVVVDAGGTLFVADADNHVIRAVDPSGTIRTLAGTPGARGYAGDGTASGIRLDWPQDLELRGDRTLLVADVFNHRVRELDLASRVIRTVAGNGAKSFLQENVAAAEATLPFPVSLAVGPDGSLYAASPRAHRVFRVGEPRVVPTPWWMSPWGWLGALLALGLLLLGVAELRARQLRARTRALEAEVADRTRALEQQRATVQRQAARLADLAAARDAVLTRISGAFRAPLTTILSSVERLRDALPDEPSERYADVVARNAQRLLRLVDQMLGLVRTPGGVVDAPGPLAVRRLLAEIVESFEPVAAEQGIELSLVATDEIALRTTRDGFETVVVNLVSNAIKYTAAGGRVRVSLEVQHPMGVLTVSDTGRGIAAADRERVFLPFERAHDEGERIPGSGLGLALVREQAAAHGGRVELDSEPGAGTTVRVLLPLAESMVVDVPALDAGLDRAEREIQSLRSRVPEAPGKTERTGPSSTVLVVEDNADMRRDLLEVLAPHFRCLAVDDGEAAIATAIREVPDLVVCDVMLPGRDGLSVCRAIKSDERTCHIPIVMLTALGDREHRLSGLAEQADDYLAKPFGEDELLLRLRNLLDLRRLLQRRHARDLRFERHLPAGLGERDRAFLSKLGRVLDARHGEHAFDPAALATALAVSERQLQRKVKALTGLTPGEVLRDYRLQRAHERLAAGDRAGVVAADSGFASHSHFAACFRARFGHAPGETRERAGGPA